MFCSSYLYYQLLQQQQNQNNDQGQQQGDDGQQQGQVYLMMASNGQAPAAGDPVASQADLDGAVEACRAKGATVRPMVVDVADRAAMDDWVRSVDEEAALAVTDELGRDAHPRRDDGEAARHREVHRPRVAAHQPPAGLEASLAHPAGAVARDDHPPRTERRRA